MKHIHIPGTRPFKRMLAIATAAAMLSVSSVALAQATSGASSSSEMSSTNGTASTSSTSSDGAAKGAATKKGMKASSDMSSAPADMHSAMSASDQQMKSMQSSGDIDRDYAMMMRAHHQGAVDMSKSEIAHGKDPEMKRLARKIMANNKKEMAQFDKWLNKQQGTKGASAKGATSKGSMSDTKSATP